MILVYAVFPTMEETKNIAKGLLNEKLIACANIFPPHTSIYEWQGRVETGQEVAMILKTTRERFEAVQSAIKARHSYECPCIISWPVEKGYQPFLDWVSVQTKPL